MITKEQCLKYLIMCDLDQRAAKDKLNIEGIATLLNLKHDEEIEKVTMADVLDYIHYLEEKNGN